MRKVIVSGLIILTIFGISGISNQKEEARSCKEKEHQQFDFWLGEWSIKQKILKADGKWFQADAETVVNLALDGCAVVENWSGEVLFFWEGMKAPEAIKGLSVRSYDTRTNKWTIHWMDTRNLQFSTFEGEFTGDKGEFFRSVKTADGKEIITRIKFSDITRSSVYWDLAVSSDRKSSWKTLWVMEMTRRVK